MQNTTSQLYLLDSGMPVTDLSKFSSPIYEYQAAFKDHGQVFLNYYYSDGNGMHKHSLTRGEFYELSLRAVTALRKLGMGKGDHIIHGFSANNPWDLVFRLAGVMTGCVPVTINWQADNDQRLIYKVKVTGAKCYLYDGGAAGTVGRLQRELKDIEFLNAEKVAEYEITSGELTSEVTWDDEKIVIFTSGTTGSPKGVSLSHRSYLANRLTFEGYYGLDDQTELTLLLTNPLHHTNSTAISDWGMRRKGAVINLLQRYTTEYWKILSDVAHDRRGLLVAPLVSRHMDFLDDLSAQNKLPVDSNDLRKALSRTQILIGSAPVGPGTVRRILKYFNHYPDVRFGSTETCLEVMATPRTLPEEESARAFETGWSHTFNGSPATGYYIGREHSPFTRVMIVRSIDSERSDFLEPCLEGEPGYLVTQGANIMTGYIGEPEATAAAFLGGWYLGLKDKGFMLINKYDGGKDFYWMSRDSELLIRGGANYAYAQIAEDLARVLIDDFHLKQDQFKLAVVGLRIGSEHEDSCCLTIELNPDKAYMQSQIGNEFILKAKDKVAKSILPHHIRFAPVPLSFKGAVLYPQLRQDFMDFLTNDQTQGNKPV